MRYVILFFVVVPLTELYLLLWVSRWIGFWPTVALTLVTGVLGGSLAKREGLKVLRQWQRALDQLQAPEAGLIEAALVLVGGAFLLTPGVMTDALGVLLLFPKTRRLVAARVRARVDRYIVQRTVVVGGPRVNPRGRSPASHGHVIDTTGSGADDPGA